MFLQMKNRRWFYRIWYYLERRTKELIFDCHMCGQCVVRSTSLVCPMTCPKQLRNGPCGGSMEGMCEVYPDRRCIWTDTYERADRFPSMKKALTKIQPGIDWSLYGTSAWLNIWPAKKIDTSGHAFSPAPVPSANLWDQREQAEMAAVSDNGSCANGTCGCKG